MPRMQTNFYLYAENIERAVLFYRQNFNFKVEGQLNAEQHNQWAALRTENALIWLGPNGARNGLIILLEEKLDEFVDQLKKMAITVFRPEELQNQQKSGDCILETEWGRHSWILDSENNIVMLFEPVAG